MFQTKLHENHNDQFCSTAQKKKYDCEIFFVQNEAQTHVAQKVPVDYYISSSGRLVSALLLV